MQELLQSEEQCRRFCNKAIEWLLNFWVPESKLFRVSYETDQKESKGESPNAASMLICRVVPELNDLARTHADPILWSKLSLRVTEATTQLKSQELYEVLPLATFGVLPLFSSCYLARLLAQSEKALDNPAYAIVMRRIILAVSKEVRSSWEATASDRMHPFDLYACSMALTGMRKLFKSAFKYKNKQAISAFWANIKKKDLLIESIAKRVRKQKIGKPSEAEMDRIYAAGPTWSWSSDRWNNLLGRLKSSLSLDKIEQSETLIDNLLRRVQERASNEALVQIASKSNAMGFELDSSALAFCLAILSSLDSNRTGLIRQGLTAIFESCEAGLFQAMPFLTDNKGRSIYVPSLEIASKALDLLLQEIDGESAPETEAAFKASSLIQNRLCERFNTIKITDSSGRQKHISGWCSDRSLSKTRVDAWVTIHALSFMLRRLELIRLIKRKVVFEDYSWFSADKCTPVWENVEDPNLGFPNHLIKEQIQQALTDKSKSPVFILYGPPRNQQNHYCSRSSQFKRMGSNNPLPFRFSCRYA